MLDNIRAGGGGGVHGGEGAEEGKWGGGRRAKWMDFAIALSAHKK